MEISQNYRGFGITYTTLGGVTTVHNMGIPMKNFHGYGEIRGIKAAKDWIDNYLDSDYFDPENYVDDDDFADFCMNW